MNSFERNAEIGNSSVVLEAKPAFQALRNNPEKQILSQFTPEQQSEIKYKQQILSSLAYFIGKDFRIPVKLNTPGQGWHWDFEKNIIRIDPQDLLDKPMDYLRFVISHEGGHRRISRTDFIPLEQWQEPGFSFMMNAIEDPRDNNFVAESYPKFKEQMALAYEQDLDFEAKAKNTADDELGFKPRFMQAGFEYIKQWFRESKGEDLNYTPDLPDDVQAVIYRTLDAAQDSWWHYPSRDEADRSEELITKYAKASYEINRDRIWPEFKTLIEEDMKDQQMQEMLKDSQQGGEGGEGGQGLPQELKDKLTPDEQQQLEEAIKEAIEKQIEKQQNAQKGENGEAQEDGTKEAGEDSEQEGKPGGAPVNLDSLSEELKQKIQDYVDSLPDDVKQELQDRAQKVLGEFEQALNEELQGKLSQNPEQKAKKESKKETPSSESEKTASLDLSDGTNEKTTRSELDSSELQKYRDMLSKEVEKDANVYEEYRREVLPIIDKLEQDLREIFVARRAKGWQSGFKSGKRIDIKRRIQEKAKDVPAMESRAWQKRELPQEKDYAISLLVDLSGSMEGEKIRETFKAVIVLTEVLNRLSINLEVLGFNDEIYEYQKFGEDISKDIRENMGAMLSEVRSRGAAYNDDGWALEQTSERLAKQKVDHKFLIVLSDGLPVPSSKHSGAKYDLGKMVKKVLQETDQKLIGLGIGSGTGHVSNYYPNSLADVNIEEMASKLADLIEEVIANYGNF